MRYSYGEFLLQYWGRNEFSPFVRGEVIPGNNGLYHEPETIYRNMAHWLCVALEIEKFEIEANTSEFVQEAINTFVRDFSGYGTFPARPTSSKDKSNGLIGSAWILESLCAGFRRHPNKKIADLLRRLIGLYEFDFGKCLWPEIVEPDGAKGGFDRTYNHQLWMAVAVAEAGKLIGQPEITASAYGFMSKLNKHMRLNRLGLIYHTIGSGSDFYKTNLKRILSPIYRREMELKEWGYHGFNLLALVRWGNFDENLSLTSIVAKLVQRCDKEIFWQSQVNNIYGPSYNPVGIEIAAARDFSGRTVMATCDALNRHFDDWFEPSQMKFNSPSDPATLNARLYEIIYLSEKTKSEIYYDGAENKWSLLREADNSHNLLKL